jgi:signal transduction histidine kinase
LSYVAVIVIALAIVAGVLTVFLIRNPYTYRQAAIRIAAAEGLISQGPRTTASLTMAANALGVRILVVSAAGELRSDTAPDQGTLRNLLVDRRIRQITSTRDINGRPWLFSRQHLSSGDWQIVATLRPGLLPVLSVVRDELWRPMMQAGLVALLLALGLAYLIARWIADPLQALIGAVRATSGSGQRAAAAASRGTTVPAATVTPERGPGEVRELTGAFNAMLRRVAASQRSQKDFVANVSHELKTPLTAIQGFSQALLDGTAATEDSRRQAAETIHREATRMFRLATELLDLARLDAGAAELHVAPVDVAALLAGLKERFEPIAASAGVILEIHVAEQLPTVTGDGDRLMQALGNIIENAIKFAPAGSRVNARAEELPGEVCVTINDSGPGIARADQERIFDRFYQVDSSRGGGKNRGSGLGLAIAREVVEGHGGKIHVRSALGQGAEFSVHLPRRVSSRDERGAA